MREWNAGYVLGVRDLARGDGHLDEVLSEVSSVTEVIGSSDLLRELVGDPSVPGEAKLTILSDLFSSRVSSRTLSLVDRAVTGEGVNGSFDALVEFHDHLASSFVAEAPGFFGTRRRVEGYATALFTEATTADLERTEADLVNVAHITDGDRGLRRALSGVNSTAEARVAIADDLFSSLVSPLTLAVLRFTVSTTRVRDVVELIEDLSLLAAAVRGTGIAEIRSARPLSDAELSSIVGALEHVTGRSLDPRTQEDPTLIAGVVAVVGNKVFDGSARNKLELARQRVSLSTRSTV